MATNLEIKKLKMELLKIAAAKAELEYKIEERKEDIARIKEHILKQEEREKELTEKLDQLGE